MIKLCKMFSGPEEISCFFFYLKVTTPIFKSSFNLIIIQLKLLLKMV